MYGKKRAIIAVLTLCAVAAASCGHEVPVAEQPSQGMSIAGGVLESSTQPQTSAEQAEVSADAEGDESEETTKATGLVLGTPQVSGITLSYTDAEVAVGQTLKYPVVSENISEVWTSTDEKVAVVDSAGNITGKGEGNCIIRVTSADDNKLGAEVKVTVKKSDKKAASEDGLTYIDGILIANKSYSLPQSYNPGGLTDETYSAFNELVQGAAADGLNIYLSSGFRSYEYQSEIYNNYVNEYGQATADTFSARPGYSEHQTGMAIDVNIIDDSFAGTPEANWIEAHCNEYGFILRYPKGKESITGYKYESWHIRYVGKDVAAKIKKAAEDAGDPYLTLEEYLHIDSYYH